MTPAKGLSLGKQLKLIKPECLSAGSNKLTAVSDDLSLAVPGTGPEMTMMALMMTMMVMEMEAMAEEMGAMMCGG